MIYYGFKGVYMRKFRTIQKKVTVEITSKEMNISLDFANEIAKTIGSESEWQALTDLKGSDIERISSGKYSIKLEDLMDQAYTNPNYKERNQKRLGFFSDKKTIISGSIPRNRKERVYQSFKINTSRESQSIMKSIKNKTLKLNHKIGSVNPKKIEPIEILSEQEKVHPLPEKPYKVDEKVFNNEPFLFWSKSWDSKPKKNKSLSSKVEVFKSVEDYNSSVDQRIGKPIL